MSGRWIACLRLAAALILCLVLSAPAFAANEAAYRLGSGDKVRVTVFNEKDLSGEYDVNDQGLVALPLIGQVRVGGLTIADAQQVITDHYGKNYLVNPRVTVEVLNYRPFFILGEVKSPGSYPYVNGMTVVNAIALAGGYTPRANKGRVSIKHATDATGREETAQEDAPVLPGDVIRVPERFF